MWILREFEVVLGGREVEVVVCEENLFSVVGDVGFLCFVVLVEEEEGEGEGMFCKEE